MSSNSDPEPAIEEEEEVPKKREMPEFDEDIARKFIHAAPKDTDANK